MAQLPFDLPKPTPKNGASLFIAQCGTCHTVEHGAQPRQGPNLAGVYMRKAGTLPGFHYSDGFAQAEFATRRLARTGGSGGGGHAVVDEVNLF